MKVRINKIIEVDNIAVVQIASGFLEWLEKQGFELLLKSDPDHFEGYEDLAQRWVQNASEV